MKKKKEKAEVVKEQEVEEVKKENGDERKRMTRTRTV